MGCPPVVGVDCGLFLSMSVDSSFDLESSLEIMSDIQLEKRIVSG